MSRKGKLILLSAVLMTGGLILNSCGDASSASLLGSSASPSSIKSSSVSSVGHSSSSSVKAEATLTGIAITVNPSKVSYAVGETFDPTGMVVTATYSDESTKAVTDYTYDKTAALTIDDTKVTVTYKGKTATVTISVAYPDLEGLDLMFNSSNGKHTVTGDANSAVVAWDKVVSNEYSFVSAKVHSGDVLNKESISITAENKNSTPLVLRIDIHSNTKHGDHNCSAINKYEDCSNPKVTTSTDLTYGGSTFTIPALETATCTVYFDLTLGAIDSVYIFLNSSTYVSDATKAVESSGSVKLSDYKANGHIDPFTKSIEITKNPTKTSYVVGDLFDPAGMEVKAVLSDKSTKAVTTYTYKTTALALEDTDFVISYVEGEKTFTANLTLIVASSAGDIDAENTAAEEADLSNKLTAATSTMTLANDTSLIQGKGNHSVKMTYGAQYDQVNLALTTDQVANLKTTTISAYFKRSAGTFNGGKAYEKLAFRFYAGNSAVIKDDNYALYLFEEGKKTAYQTIAQEGGWWHATLDLGAVITAAKTTDEALATITRINIKSVYGEAGVIINIDNLNFTH